VPGTAALTEDKQNVAGTRPAEAQDEQQSATGGPGAAHGGGSSARGAGSAAPGLAPPRSRAQQAPPTPLPLFLRTLPRRHWETPGCGAR
jgi:hypothetical protein